MALQKTLNQFLLAKGPNTNLTPEALSADTLTILENSYVDKIGAIRHKPGADAAITTVATNGVAFVPSTIGTVEEVFNFNEMPVVASTSGLSFASPNQMFAFDRSTDKWRIADNYGRSSSTLVDTFTYGKITDNRQVIDSVYYDGLLYVAVATDTTQSFIIVDPNSQAAIATLFSTTNSTSAPTVPIGTCRVIKFNNKIYFFYWITVTQLWLKEYNPATGGVLVDQLVVNDLMGGAANGTLYDIYVNDASSIVYLAYKESTGGTIKVNSYSSLTSGAPATPLTTTNATTIGTVTGGCLSIFAGLTLSTPRIFVAYTNATNANCFVMGFTLALGAGFGPVTALALTANEILSFAGSNSVYGGTSTLYVSSVRTSTGVTYLRTDAIGLDSAGLTGVSSFMDNYYLYSKPYQNNGRDYIWFVDLIDPEQQCYLLASTFGVPSIGGLFYVCGKIFSGAAASSAQISSAVYRFLCPQISGVDTNGNIYTVAQKTISELASDSTRLAGCVLSFNTTTPSRWQNKSIADSLAFVGGMAEMYDGEAFYEINFPLYPAKATSITLSAGAGSISHSSSYAMQFVYEFIDANGKVHLSAPSSPDIFATSPTENTAVVVLRNNTKDLTRKGRYNLLVFRTTANGSTYYFDQRVTNIQDTLVLTINILISDTVLQSRGVIYTSAGELYNTGLWGVNAIDVYKDRLFALTPDGLYYSKKVEIGDPVEFAEELQIPIESAGGPATGIAALQDKLLIFKRDRLYYIIGDGPNDTGTFGDFSQPLLVNTSLGCINYRSIVQSEGYVYFQSKESICRISADLQIEKIGQPLDHYLVPQPTILTAIVLPNQRQVRWADANRTYIWSTESSQWAVWPTTASISSTLIGDVYYYVNNSNALIIEDPTSIAESSGSAIAMNIATGWIRVEAVQGFQRVYSIFILGRKRGNHNLTVKIMYDYVPDVVETHTINESTANSYIYTDQQVFESASIPSGTDQTNKPYQYRIKLARQKVQSVRLLISDADASSGVGTADIIALAFELGVKRLAVKSWIGSSRTV